MSSFWLSNVFPASVAAELLLCKYKLSILLKSTRLASLCLSLYSTAAAVDSDEPWSCYWIFKMTKGELGFAGDARFGFLECFLLGV